MPPLRQRLREDPRELDDLLESMIAGLINEPLKETVAAVRASLHESVGRDYAWPGNVRELEQAVRRILLKRRYEGDECHAAPDRTNAFTSAIEAGSLDADALLGGYCALLYERCANYEEVARRTGLDRRTVRKYLVHATRAQTQRRQRK
jgi:transcriptional regulator with GAF, ATPase, and Fis domain